MKRIRNDVNINSLFDWILRVIYNNINNHCCFWIGKNSLNYGGSYY